MDDLSSLIDAFEALSSKYNNSADRVGLQISLGEAAKLLDEITIESVRRRVFLMIATNIERRLSYQRRATIWPFTPQNACNLGFLISESGYAIGYFSGCGCLPSYQDDPDHFYVLMIDDNGAYSPFRARPVLTFSGEYLRLGDSNGYLLHVEIPKQMRQLIPLGRMRRDYNDRLYTLGSSYDQWVIGNGSQISEASDNDHIATDIDCYHGFCGSQLFSHSGVIVGLGARISFDPRDRHGETSRAYGISWFDRLETLLSSAPSDVYESLYWIDL